MSLINRTNFARSIKDPEILFTDDSTAIFLYLKKVKKNTFDGYIGFNTNEENGKLEIQGYARINLTNTFNQGEEIKIDFLSEDSQDRFLNSQVRMPFIFNSPLSLNTGLKLIQKDSIYNSRDFFVDLELLKKQFRGGLGYEKTESVNEIPFQNVEEFKKNIFNLFISYELIDPNDSFEFYNLRFFLKAGIGEKNQSDEKNKVGKFKIEMTKKFEISEKLKINSRFLSEKLDSKNLVTNELLRFGGIESIRGFDQNSIFTNDYKLLNTSVNFYLNDTIYIYTLFDVANYQNKILSIDEFIYSGGFGFSSRTKNGLISVNYAKGNIWGNSFNLKNAKLSVSFVTFF
jgi:hemolysin activation/secretion protein